MPTQLFPAPSYYLDSEQKTFRAFGLRFFFIIGVEGESPQINELGSQWVPEATHGIRAVQLGAGVQKNVSPSSGSELLDWLNQSHDNTN